MIHPRWQHKPFSGEGARLFGGRWNVRGQSALYLACDAVTAINEFYQGLPKPGLLAPYHLTSDAIADLTGDDPRVAKALSSEWETVAPAGIQLPPSWMLAQELIAAGAEGALVPSVQNRGGVNLVLWRWHDAGGPGEGAALSLLDPEAALTRA